MCRRFSYGNYTWKNTFGKRVVLVVSNRIPLPRREHFFFFIEMCRILGPWEAIIREPQATIWICVT
jgi:hypothetical protein